MEVKDINTELFELYRRQGNDHNKVYSVELDHGVLYLNSTLITNVDVCNMCEGVVKHSVIRGKNVFDVAMSYHDEIVELTLREIEFYDFLVSVAQEGVEEAIRNIKTSRKMGDIVRRSVAMDWKEEKMKSLKVDYKNKGLIASIAVNVVFVIMTILYIANHYQ